MPVISARAPGKAILIGEHAVVYGRPAIAVPVAQVQAKASVRADIGGPTGRVWLEAPDIGLDCDASSLPEKDPLPILVNALQAHLGIDHFPALRLRLTSSIPVAAGLGSGAAVSVAAIRALAEFCGRRLQPEEVSGLAYQVERIYHGTPSGIDNTVVTYAQPVFFIRNQPFELIRVAQPFTLVIGDSGIFSPTGAAVSGVRQRWQANPGRYEGLFDAIAGLAHQARAEIEAGRPQNLGALMDENHQALQEIGVSCPELDRLVSAARAAGAVGSKLSGGGLGGNMIALANEENAAGLASALQAAGAVRTIITTVS